MKQWLLRQGRLGSLAISARETVDLFLAVRNNPEAAGTVANDVLALRLVSRLGLPGKTFVDVGAHIGSVLSQVRQACPSMSIEAVEAIPEKVDTLRSSFPDVKVHACAVGESPGHVDFYVNTEKSGYSSLFPQGPSARTIRVPMQRLDDLVNPQHVDLMKIDVEGPELPALRGAQRLLTQSRPTLMFESGPINDDSTAKLYEHLRNLDYRVVLPQRLAHYDDGLSLEGFLESHLYPRRSTNYFAVHASRRDELRARARQVLKMPASN
ncbi:MAG: FkbM family methyltransferase [Rubrivivax sp.]|jgi:FkbM family methyltransferase|nr:FkbM family methyltransferase [Rubrivivax sp.]